ncbi:PhzF family phenazine biosynthesis protein [Draconibacterium orientale]|uniref:PhzF family phenazine biosynthesis protein n=1 Tax=Draconibacterium orientale TaxID=1168034 RepID=UPI0029BFFB7E|nr:PhzF family phenazine biosynthesis protein [Draconibacterium orientale]
MNLTVYQVDAFAEKVFEGNPAAVIPLNDEWLPDDMMQKLAMENNLSETAFFIKKNDAYHIRWFTPEAEVDLCGHATLATSHVMFQHLNLAADKICFQSRSGKISVKKEGDLLVLNFPASEVEAKYIPTGLKTAFGIHPQECFKGREDLMLVFKNENDIASLEPDFTKMLEATSRGIICTAKSEKYDFVSRFFAPSLGINEDPVTGSAHTMLIPYWSAQLDKQNLLAKQISKRGGVLHCKQLGDRVEIGGKAVTYLVGTINI